MHINCELKLNYNARVFPLKEGFSFSLLQGIKLWTTSPFIAQPLGRGDKGRMQRGGQMTICNANRINIISGHRNTCYALNLNQSFSFFFNNYHKFHQDEDIELNQF